MIATIHQPDFFPWFGFFDKITKSDVWIVLDHVTNNPRDAAFWGRRVRILTPQGPQWLSVPLNKPQQRGVVGIPISEMTINTQASDQLEKSLNKVRASYRAYPYFRATFPLVEEYFCDSDASLVARNMRFISTLFRQLGIERHFVFSSRLGIRTAKSQLLADLIERVEATVYVCGMGALAYQDDEVFKSRGIRVEYNTFDPPTYPQQHSKNFVPGMSILDALFAVPLSEVRTWLLNSREKFREKLGATRT